MNGAQIFSLLKENMSWWMVLLLIVLSVVQLTPVKLNPWSWILKSLGKIMKSLGKVINSDLCEKIETVSKQQIENRQLLDKHVSDDKDWKEKYEAQKMDELRLTILHFNNELLRKQKHTKEEFVEILTDIDRYKRYCKTHEDYPNSRAVHAIANIERVYDERLEKNDFLETTVGNSGK